MEEQKQTLYIPTGLNYKKELFKGFSGKELFQAFIIFSILGAINFGIYLWSQNLGFFGIILMISTVIAASLTMKDGINNMNALDYIRLMLRFHWSKKEYKYGCLDEWR